MIAHAGLERRRHPQRQVLRGTVHAKLILLVTETGILLLALGGSIKVLPRLLIQGSQWVCSAFAAHQPKQKHADYQNDVETPHRQGPPKISFRKLG
jgi:hypothetical protein